MADHKERKPNSHHRKYETLLELKNLLHSKPYTKKELAEKFNTTDRTIERLIVDLQNIGVKVEGRKDSKGKEHHFFCPIPPEKIDPVEALLSHVALRLVAHHTPGFNNQYLKALKKITQRIPQNTQMYIEESLKYLETKKNVLTHIQDKPVDLTMHLETIANAYFERRIITFEYCPPSSQQWSKYKLDVYFIEISRTNLGMYIIGWVHDKNAILTFKLNRMRFISVLAEEYTIPETFSPSEYLSNSWGVIGSGKKSVQVKLKFAPEAAYRILEEYNPLFQIEERANPTDPLMVSFTVGTDNYGFPTEILPWVQSWGNRVEVLEPPNLRSRWLTESRAIIYNAGDQTMNIEPIFRLWAKSSKTDHRGHPVIAHLLDVAATTEVILELEPCSTLKLFAEDFNLQDLDQAKAWVCALAGLHDIGKVSPTFQEKWDVGAAKLAEVESKYNKGHRLSPQTPQIKQLIRKENIPHNHVSEWVLPALLSKNINTMTAKTIASAVGCHHGFRATARELNAASKDEILGIDPIWAESREMIFNWVLDTVGVDKEQVLQIKSFSPSAFMRLAGLTSFADWIGSGFYPNPNIDFFAYKDNLTGYYQQVKQFAREQLERMGWTKREVLNKGSLNFAEIFSYLVPDGTFTPRPLQNKIAEMLENVSKPTLLLIEAAMGEGKTEAAFYAHLRLQQVLEHRGLYVALPTRATGNAMFERTLKFLQAQGEDREIALDLQLLHGGTELNSLYQQLRAVEPEMYANTSNSEDEKELVAARAYFTAKKRALLSEYGVGTVDQALLTILNVKHQFVRLWGLGNRVVVIDEVHAYDTYTSELIVQLVRWLKELGSSVVIMSATLPYSTREKLLSAYGATESTEGFTAYPRIFKVSGNALQSEHFAGDTSREMQITLQSMSQNLEAIVTLLHEKLANGGCAVCIVNTVDRAQELYTLLEGFERDIFHARYPANQRQELENTVLAKFGKDAKHRPEKAVLIATQVVEQSLDLDFDLMISDLAPVDLLLQRAGRLWRHQRQHRPITQPVLYVAGLEVSGELPDLHTYYWDKVYNSYFLYRTWHVLKNVQHIQLPQNIDPLVQTVYSSTEPEWELSGTALAIIAEKKKKWEAEEEADTLDAHNAVINEDNENGKLKLQHTDPVREETDDPNGKPIAMTRKGDPSVTVIPIYHIAGKYFLDAQGSQPYKGAKDTELFSRGVGIGRIGIVGNVKKRVPSALEQYNQQNELDKKFKWEKKSLLYGCVPMVLDPEGQITIGNTKVTLDPVLGLRYEKL